MAITSPSTSGSPDVQTPLLLDTVDYKGLPAHKSTSGGWRSASFIIGVEVAERFAHFGISSNLITYLTGPLGQSTATAAENVNAWSGTASLLPLLGAFVADSFLGRYRTIVVASLIYLLGLGLMTISAMFPSHSASGCPSSSTITSCSPHLFEVVLFFFALYLAALGQGGHKPCVQAFGADQFDGKDPEECKAKSSFFNWCVKAEENSAVLRIGRVFLATIRNWRTYPSAITLEEEARGMLPHHGSEQFRFLNKTLLAPNGLKGDEKVCSLSEVEEAKAVLKLIPIWATCLVYAVVFAQSTTFFTKQGLTMDRSISKGLDIPPATLQCFSSFAVILFIPIYDRVFVPIARALTGKPSGITMLQRIGTGMFLSALTTAIAALVEMKRLEVAREHGLVDLPDVTLPMSARWLIPQYALFGVADVFTMIGLQEFFYDQVPRELRSVGLSLYLSIFGVGSFLSSFLISAIEKITSGQGHDSWFANNLNRGHLDYFYWLLAGLSMVQFVAYLYLAKNYIYNR
ncbi:hypothetical protein GH714_021399 [Hevea brasiliensis]|uniref:Uncharacterized protein n=1 Tax=Hevea brasiliensis TaxID=3981 RepID=A0A6A6LB50_HEVBR|nr:hypothetical protein GH714_021399 [Hevea brasiliensis]